VRSSTARRCYDLIPMCRVSIDTRALPSLVPPRLLNITARAVVPVIEDNITKLKALLASNDLPSEANPTTRESICQFAVYAQVHPSNVSAAAMRELEEELLHPTGITTVHRPPLKLDVAVISPECGILIEAKDANGMRSRIFFRKVTSCASRLWFDPASATDFSFLARCWIRWARLPCHALVAFATDVREQISRTALSDLSLVVYRPGPG
jgi:hypothetical protein